MTEPTDADLAAGRRGAVRGGQGLGGAVTSKLTVAQRQALDGLTPKRRAFVLAYVGEACGNATEAARIAGYASPHPEGAQLLQNPTVANAVESMRAPVENRKIATVNELREMWTEWARTGAMTTTIEGKAATVPLDAKDRLKAAELLAKSQGAFVERREISGPGGGPIDQQIRAVVMPGPLADELAAEPPRLALESETAQED